MALLKTGLDSISWAFAVIIALFVAAFSLKAFPLFGSLFSFPGLVAMAFLVFALTAK